MTLKLFKCISRDVSLLVNIISNDNYCTMVKEVKGHVKVLSLSYQGNVTRK